MVSLQIKLPNSFLEEEIRCGYKISKEMKKLWAVELDLLAQVQNICKKHDIDYFASDGTLLGAVRYGGFIPWDDDIDVMMSRENYIKFCKFAKKELKAPYFLQTEETDPTSILGLAKIRNSDTTMILKAHEYRNFKFNQGCFIDIFPLDNIPDSENERKKFQKKLSRLKERARILRNRFHQDYNDKSILKKILSKVPIKNYYYLKFEKVCQKYNHLNTKNCACIFYKPERVDFFSNKSLLKKELFDFEFLKIPVPTAYDELLTITFGDWKKFVIGKSDHGELIVDTNESYKVFKSSKTGIKL